MTAKILTTVSIISLTISAFIVIFQVADTRSVATALSVDQKNEQVKILIVPGHEPNSGGADEFKKIKERDLNLQLSEILQNILSKNTKLEISLARDKNGWNKDLEKFVTTNETKIMDWAASNKKEMLARADKGEFKIIDPDMKHNEAASNAVLFLYGTNKWIEENKIDLTIHIHFNNNPKINGKPNYRGYSMYIPEKQYSNSSSSRIFANYLNEEIFKIQKQSNMPQEKDIIIESQELIAIGNYDTLKIPSVVVEYAYIYEPVMLSSSTRNAFIEKAASSTATAINQYIEKEFIK